MELAKQRKDCRGYVEQRRVVLTVDFCGGGVASEVSKYVL